MVLSTSLLLESVLNFDRHGDEAGEVEIKMGGSDYYDWPSSSNFLHFLAGCSQFLGSCYGSESK